MESMLLVHGDESSFVNHGYISSGVGVNVRENLEHRKQIPKVRQGR